MPETPILAHSGVLIASIQSALSDSEILSLRSQLLARISHKSVRGVVIDVSALDVLDSFATRTLNELASGARLRGAQTVVVGIQPDVALSMVLLGLTLRDAETALDLDAALGLLESAAGRRDG
ncbi:MAG: STAS domain-containing protein [Neomegalonema sp.]|nr:STAS domain-containing protein [Neomegalonema sp.]